VDKPRQPKATSVDLVEPSNGRDVFTARERELVDAAQVARLATVRPDGRPHLVPVTFGFFGPTEIVTAVDHKPKRSTDLQRIRNIEANPQVSLLIDHYDDDWSRLWWLRLDGTARVVREEPGRSTLADALRHKYDAYASRPPAGPVLAIEVLSVTSWKAGDEE
jgi:PPOX class probable F420-dependent enzyme